MNELQRSLQACVQELLELETKYNLDHAEFQRELEAGNLGDEFGYELEMDALRWDDLLTEWELDRRKITEESAHYRRQHAQLSQDYLGQYIAMHQGVVIDHGEDFAQLRQRVRQQFPDTAVMITLVTEDATPVLERKGVEMELMAPIQTRTTSDSTTPSRR